VPANQLSLLSTPTLQSYPYIEITRNQSVSLRCFGLASHSMASSLCKSPSNYYADNQVHL